MTLSWEKKISPRWRTICLKVAFEYQCLGGKLVSQVIRMASTLSMPSPLLTLLTPVSAYTFVLYNPSTKPYGCFPQTVDSDVINISCDCDCCHDTGSCRTLSVSSVTLAVVGHVYELLLSSHLLLEKITIKSDMPVNGECK